MPFDNPSKRIQALYAFVDQYISGDAARRSQLDQFFNDLIASSNAGIAYLEGLTGSSTDQRYLGRSATVPTQRVNATALQAGDFYVSSAAPAGRVGLVHVYDGSAFVVDSDFLTVGAFFKDTLSAADTAAAARGALGLGDASVQNASAFAAASVATDVALAIKILANGIAKNLTDWNTAHSVGPGSSFVQGNAAATNGPVAENISGVYTAYDANNGFILASAHVTGMIYFRARSAATWGAWVNMSPGVSSVTAVLLTDAAATLTATQLVANKLFTITPTVARILTTATGTQIATAMSGAPVGTSVAFTIVNLGAFDVTLAAGAGVTIVGKAVINNGSGTWRIRVDSASAVTIFTEAALNTKGDLNATGAAPIYACRAWVNFNGTGTPAIRASGNVSSITDNGVGDYTVNFTTAMPDADYAVAAMGGINDSNCLIALKTAVAAGSFRLETATSNTRALTDYSVITAAVFR